MSKTSKQNTPNNKPKCFYTVHPWQCVHEKDQSSLTAYVEASGKWETVLTVHPTSGASAETMAEYLVKIVNDKERDRHILRFTLNTLELILADGGKLTFSSEQELENAVMGIKRVLQ